MNKAGISRQYRRQTALLSKHWTHLSENQGRQRKTDLGAVCSGPSHTASLLFLCSKDILLLALD